jgi:putative oxidoreductase
MKLILAMPIKLTEIASRFPDWLSLLFLRFALAVPFFYSGLTKWDGFLSLSGNAIFLFKEEFKLHLFGRIIDYPAPVIAAWLSGIFEIVLPILLVVGLATRLSALGLLIMTVIIQVTIPDGWANFHLPWAAMAMAIMSFGPGKLSLDRLLSIDKPATSMGTERLTENRS